MAKVNKQRQLGRAHARAIFASMKAKKQDDLRFDGIGEVSIQAAGNGEGESTLSKFSMVAYAGSKMRPGGWYADAPLIVDVAGMEYPKSQVIPVHRDHDTGKVVGHTTAIEAKNQLKLSGVVSATNDHAAEIVGSSKNEFPWQSSIGATLLAAPQYVGEGETVFVNGRRHAGPVYVARKTRLFEASFVSLGADPRTSAVAANKGQSDMEPFDKWLTANGFEKESLNDKALAVIQAQFDALLAGESEESDASTKKAGAKLAASGQGNDDSEVDPLAERRKLIAAEMKRESVIQAKLARHPEIAVKAIEEGWNEDKIELEALRASAGRAPAIHVTPNLKETPDAIEAALFLTQFSDERAAVRHYGEKTVEAARRKCPSSAGLKWLIHEVIRAGGEHAHPGVFDQETVRALYRAERALQAQQRTSIYAAGGFSTISLAGVLGNLANKSLLRAYEAVPSVIAKFCRIASHSDFKTHTKYRITTAGSLEEVGPTGEITHTEMSEESYTNQITTKARMMALTRTMMKNDDLDAFLQIPASFGRMAATTREQSVFAVLLNNTDSFFTTTPTAGTYQANALGAGAGSALSVTSLGLAENLFWNQTDTDGKPIMLQPSILLVDSSRKRDAENICNRTTVTVAGDPTSGEQLRVGNEFQGQFEPVASAWVHNTLLTGASATQWWLLAAPTADVAAIEIAYLDGRTVPTIESADTDFNTLGMQWRCYYDWGVAKQDPRAGVRSPGA